MIIVTIFGCLARITDLLRIDYVIKVFQELWPYLDSVHCEERANQEL
jgi:hypothetical protein